MRRSSSAAAAAVGCALLVSNSAHAADPPTELPRANCVKRWIDPAGDAYFNPSEAPAANVPKAGSGLDIVSMFMRTTADEVQFFLKMADIPAAADMAPNDVGLRYVMSFKHGTKTIEFQHGQLNPDYAALGGQTYPSAVPAMPTPHKVRGWLDPATDWVFVGAPRAAIEGLAAGTPVTAGEAFTAVSARTEWDGSAGALQFTSDTVAPAGDAGKFVIGDDFCFGPPPGTLSDVTAPALQFGDAGSLTAKLVDEAGAAVADAPITFKIGTAAPLTANTDATGIARLPYTATLVAGTYPVEAAFAGNATVGKAVATGSLVVRNEVTKFGTPVVKKTSATARTVTVALVDDDGKPVVGQKVAWYVNGKLTTTLVTDAAGKTLFRSAKAGQSIQARFAAVAGKYEGSSAAKKV